MNQLGKSQNGKNINKQHKFSLSTIHIITFQFNKEDPCPKQK